MSISAPVWPCSRCGAPLPLAGSRPLVCPHCGATTEPPADGSAGHDRRLEEMLHAARDRLATAPHYGGYGVGDLASQTMVACGGCGGPVAYRPDDASARCPHCGATTFATRPIEARLVSSAAAVADRATEDGVRAARGRHLKEYEARRTARGLLVWSGVAVLALAGVGLVAGGAIDLATDGDAAGDLGLIGAGLVAFALAFLPPWLRRFPRKPGLETAATSLAGRTRGALARDHIDASLRFLNAYWPDAALPGFTCFRSASERERRWSIAAWHQGCPTLVVVVDAADGTGPWTAMLLAAELPLTASPDALATSPPASYARSLGAQVRVYRAGICAQWDRADPALLDPAVVTRLFADAAAIVSLGRAPEPPR